jgi:hypothetical protein
MGGVRLPAQPAKATSTGALLALGYDVGDLTEYRGLARDLGVRQERPTAVR